MDALYYNAVSDLEVLGYQEGLADSAPSLGILKLEQYPSLRLETTMSCSKVSGVLFIVGSSLNECTPVTCCGV